MLDARSTAMNRRTATIVNGTSYAIRYDAANRVVEEWMQVKDLPEASAGVADPGTFTLSKPVEPTAPPPGSTQAVIDQYNIDMANYRADLRDYNEVYGKYTYNKDNYTTQYNYANRVNTQARAVSGYERHLRSYNAVGQVVHEQGYQDDGQVKYHQVNQSIDALGNARLTVTDSFVGDSATSTYNHAYFRGLYSAQQASTTGTLRLNSGQLAGQTGMVVIYRGILR